MTDGRHRQKKRAKDPVAHLRVRGRLDRMQKRIGWNRSSSPLRRFRMGDRNPILNRRSLLKQKRVLVLSCRAPTDDDVDLRYEHKRSEEV